MPASATIDDIVDDTATPALIDWQLWSVGRSVSDVAFLLCRDLLIEERRRTEMELLRGYWKTLLEQGITGYTFEECVRDYRLALLKWFANLLVSSAVSDSTIENVRNAYALYIPRCVAAILDHEANALLPA